MKTVFSLVLALASSSLWAHVSAENAWIRLLPPNVTTTAAYVILVPTHDDRLTGASSEFVERIEIHESSMTDGMMSMREVEGIDLFKDQALVLEPSGYHLMLIGIKRPFEEGETIYITLELEETGTQVFGFKVRNP